MTVSKLFQPGEKWSGVIGRGKSISFTALGEGANLSLLFYNAREPAERYSLPDTIKAQHTTSLTTGNVLMSDSGRVMLSVVRDDTGWIDTIAGFTTRKDTAERWGKTTYQDNGHAFQRCGWENLVAELVRHGLGLQDLMPPVNLFSKVTCSSDGALHFVDRHAPMNSTIVLRTELDVLALVSNTPCGLDRRGQYPSVAVAMEVALAPPVGPDDPAVRHSPENRRAFENTWEYWELMGGLSG